jgi:hypothetical protein
VARSITDPDHQAWALARVAEALAGTEQHQQAARVAREAKAVARSMGDPDHQADALAQVAEGLAVAGHTRSAYRVAAATCAAGRWTTAAKPVLLLNPSAFADLARVLDNGWYMKLSR